MNQSRLSPVASLVGLLCACSSGSSDSSEISVGTHALTAQSIVAQMTLPSTLTGAAFLGAQNKIQLDSRVDINGTLWSAGTVYMQPDAKAQAITCTGNVTLTDRDTVSGITLGGTLTKGNGNVIGTVNRVPLSNVTSTQTFTFPATTQTVIVDSLKSKTLNPGSYVSANVNSGATLILLAGDYYFSSLSLESNAVLRLSPGHGAIRVFVASNLSFRPTIASGADPSRFFMAYLGTNTVTLETPFLGSFVAPRAALNIGTANSMLHRGSFMAQSIEVQPGAKVEFVPFDPTGTPSSCAAETWDSDGNPFTPCVPMTTCPPGSYVYSQGSPTSDRTCTPCPSDQFSTVANAASCTPWSAPCAAGTFESTAPSATKDRVCSPASQCPAGTHVSGYASGSNDTTCEPCATGSFTATPNLAAQCTPWTPCGAGQVVITPPTSTSDTVCQNAPCPQGLGPEMRLLPGGFCIDSTEVTRNQYMAWLAMNPDPAIGQDSVCAWNNSYAVDAACLSEGEVCTTPDCGNRPVVCVDWCDATAFCKAAGKRLCGKVAGGANDFDTAACSDPTKSQWYAACSSGGVRAYPYGDTYDQNMCMSPYENSTSHISEVGTHPSCQSDVAGYQGVYDLSGNVWEWEDACTAGDGSAYCHLRGGSYYSYGGGLSENAYFATCARCGLNIRNYRRASVGFRCCN